MCGINLDALSLPEKFIPVVNRHQLGIQQSKPSSSIVKENLGNIGIILTESSYPRLLKPTRKSSSMMQLSEPKLEEDKASYSQTGTISSTFTLPSSCLMVLDPVIDRDHLQLLDAHNLTYVLNLIPQTDAPIIQPPAGIAISAPGANIKTN
jgi:hypothetical protein